MDKVRGRFRQLRNRFGERIDNLPSCWRPKRDMPKLIYTVMDNRECESLLCDKYAASETKPCPNNHGRRGVGAGCRELTREVSMWDKTDRCEGNSELWKLQLDKQGPTIRLATFDVALFSLAPAIPPDHPCAAPFPDHFQSTPAHYLSSESSTFSYKSKSTSSEASSGMTFFSNSRESCDSAETCAVLSHASKPTHTFNTLMSSCINNLGNTPTPKVSPVKQAAFDIRRAWKASPLAAKTRAICHFKPGGGRNSLNGPFYHSKLNPVFSLSNNSSKCLVDSLPCLFSKVSFHSHLKPGQPTSSTTSLQQLTLRDHSPGGTSPERDEDELNFSPSSLMLRQEARVPVTGSGCTSETVILTPFDVVQSGSSSPSISTLDADVSPQNTTVTSSAFTSAVASPCSNLSPKDCNDPPPLVSEARVLSILEILLEVDADIIALQEVKAEEERGMKPLSELAEALGMEYAYAESWAPDFGNAVLSRWPIKSASVQQIHDETDYRNVLKVVVSVPLAGDLHFYCTQLDHLDEDWRMKQVESLMSMVPPNQPHILSGNLNALEHSDYSQDRWEEISESRKKNNKAPPRADVMKKLLQEKNYADAKTLGGDELIPEQVLQNKKEVQGTCQHGTRVDYILGSPKLPFNFIPGTYSVVSSRGTSNHDLVVVDLQPHFHS